ncbi:unnamed protein product [Diamesa serratosioi]
MSSDKFLLFLIGVVIFYVEFTVGFECILTHMKHMEGSKFADYSNLRVRRTNRTNFLLTGNFTYFEDTGNNHQIQINILKKLGNKYQLTPYHMKKENYCDFVANHAIYEDLRKVSDIPREGVCPWPKGTYKIYGFNIEVERIPPFFDGDYMLETIIYMNDNEVSLEQLFGTIMGSGGWDK